MEAVIVFVIVLALAWGAGRIAPVQSKSVSPPPPLPGGFNQWDNQIRYAASVNGLPSEAAYYIKAMIQSESAGTWDPEVLGDPSPLCASVYGPHPYGNRSDGVRVSTAGWCGMGLMQVNRKWHPGATGDLLNGNDNILAGAQILAGYWRTYGGDWRKTLAAYNGGSVQGDAYPAALPLVQAYVDVVYNRAQGYLGQVGIAV